MALAAVAGLVGMFSKQPTEKLQETFDTLFRTAPGEGDDLCGGKVDPNAPEVSIVIPSQLQHGSTNLTLTISGRNFVKVSSAEIGGASV